MASDMTEAGALLALSAVYDLTAAAEASVENDTEAEHRRKRQRTEGEEHETGPRLEPGEFSAPCSSRSSSGSDPASCSSARLLPASSTCSSSATLVCSARVNRGCSATAVATGKDKGNNFAGRSMPLVRDPRFYFPDADCAIQVDDTLFRVHKFLLARDSSAFQDMFSMPAPCHPEQHVHPLKCTCATDAEGYSDDNPIPLFGETPDRFRALLSVLYALPSELQSYNTRNADIPQLLIIAVITNKYHFASIESWAVDAVHDVTSGTFGPPLPQYDLSSCHTKLIQYVLEVALLTGHTRLRDLVIEKWTARLWAGGSTPDGLRPAPAVVVADRYGLRTFQGVAYYMLLKEYGARFVPAVCASTSGASIVAGGNHAQTHAQGPNEGHQDADADAENNEEKEKDKEDPSGLHLLTRTQRARLLSGFFSLSALWDTLRSSPPKFQRPEGCTYHQHGCLSTWSVAWTEAARSDATLKFGAADVLGRLQSMEGQLKMNADLACALTGVCKRRALGALRELVNSVTEGLADHFVDLTA